MPGRKETEQDLILPKVEGDNALLTKREKDLLYHKITGNESIGDIAGMYGVTPQTLLDANPTLLGTPPAGAFLNVPKIGGGVTPNKGLLSTMGNATLNTLGVLANPIVMGGLSGGGPGGGNPPPPTPTNYREAGGGVTPNMQPIPKGGIYPEPRNFANLALGQIGNYIGQQSGFTGGQVAGQAPQQGGLAFPPAPQLGPPAPGQVGTGVQGMADSSILGLQPNAASQRYARPSPPIDPLKSEKAWAEKDWRYELGQIVKGLSLASHDEGISGTIDPYYLPVFVSGEQYSYLSQEMKDKIRQPISSDGQGGYGGLWNPRTNGYDMPSTAPGATPTPGMSYARAYEFFEQAGVVPNGIMPYFVSDADAVLYDNSGYYGFETKKFKSMGGVRGVDAYGNSGWIFPNSVNKPADSPSPSGAPDGSGGNSGGEVYDKRKADLARRGGGSNEGGSIPYTPASYQPYAPKQPQGPQTPTFAPETLALLDKILKREVPSATAIEQLEWFLTSGALTPEQTILVQNELERLKIARDLALATSFGSSSSTWRIG